MLHTIENDALICKIESVGAEVRSLVHKSTGKEYIWQIDSSVWGSSSPVLFPAIGNIKDNVIVYKGKEYAMTKHGIIRNNNKLKFQQSSKTKCSFSLESSAETKTKYPFDFRFNVIYELVGNCLTMKYDIENKDTEVMYFSCGGHTAYYLPLNSLKQLSDYVIEFSAAKTKLIAETLGDSGLLSYRRRYYDLYNNCLELSSTIFDEDALIFEDLDTNWVRLKQKKEEKGVVVRFNGFPHLALWSKPQADYVCIEPWLGLPDREDESFQLNKKQTYQSLEPNKIFSISIQTIIE